MSSNELHTHFAEYVVNSGRRRKIIRVPIEMPVPMQSIDLGDVTSLSTAGISDAYHKLGVTREGTEVWKKKDGHGYIAGYSQDGRFYILLSIAINIPLYMAARLPHGLDPECEQVHHVFIADTEVSRDLAKAVYELIGSKFDLFSDHHLTERDRGLWESLAQCSDVNVYMFDGNSGEYAHDESGKIIKYNGTNIVDDFMAGRNELAYENRLLVATTKTLS